MEVKQDNIYKRKRYNHLERWSSYWYQINETLRLSPTRVLEVGCGSSVVANFLKDNGISVTTLDISPATKPDILSSVLKIPSPDNSYDIVLASQILEHLPFSDFPKALSQIHRVSKKYSIISLPHCGRTIKILIKIPALPLLKKVYKLPRIKKNKHNTSNGHYWEIGKLGFSLNKIKKSIENSGFKVIRDYTCFEHSYHHFFILEKQ